MRTIVCVALLALCTGALSQQPPPTPSKSGNPPQERAAQAAPQGADQQPNTKKSPIFVELLNTGKSPKEAETEAQKENEKASREGWLIIFSGIAAVAAAILSIITGLLAKYTYKLWRATVQLGRDATLTSERQARETQNALVIAKGSADAAKETVALTRVAFISTHRPQLIVREIALKEVRGDNGITAVNGIQYIVANKGATKAIIVEGNATAIAHQDEHGRLPIVPAYEGKRDAGVGLEIESGGFCQLTYIDPKEILGQFFLTTETRRQTSHNILFFGYFVYEDIVGTKRRTAFARLYDASAHRFVAIGHPDYEYAD